MDADAPGGPLCARLSASEAGSGARVARGAEGASGARSANRISDTAPSVLATDTPPRGSSGPQGALQWPNAAQDQPPAQRAAESHTGPPEQLTLPADLIAAVCLPDIANYQPEENR